MRAYETVWLGICSASTVIAVAAAALWSIAGTVTIFGFAALIAGALTGYMPLLRGGGTVPRPRLVRLVARNAFAGGAATAAIIGLAILFGVWALPALILFAGCSPFTIQACRRWLRRRPAVAAVAQPDPQSDDSDGDPPAEAGSVLTMEAPVDTATMSEADLCRAWRTSFPALQAASSESQRLRIIESRSAYLDELERRNPQGLSAWLASGARAAGNPTDFVIGTSGAGRPPIDWDELIPGQDR